MPQQRRAIFDVPIPDPDAAAAAAFLASRGAPAPAADDEGDLIVVPPPWARPQASHAPTRPLASHDPEEPPLDVKEPFALPRGMMMDPSAAMFGHQDPEGAKLALKIVGPAAAGIATGGLGIIPSALAEGGGMLAASGVAGDDPETAIRNALLTAGGAAGTMGAINLAGRGVTALRTAWNAPAVARAERAAAKLSEAQQKLARELADNRAADINAARAEELRLANARSIERQMSDMQDVPIVQSREVPTGLFGPNGQPITRTESVQQLVESEAKRRIREEAENMALLKGRETATPEGLRTPPGSGPGRLPTPVARRTPDQDVIIPEGAPPSMLRNMIYGATGAGGAALGAAALYALWDKLAGGNRNER